MRLSISIGEPAGVGLEVTLKALRSKDLPSSLIPILYGPSELISSQSLLQGQEVHIIQEATQATAGRLNLVHLPMNGMVLSGKPDSDSGDTAFHSLERAFADVRNGITDALVTAPIDKKNIQREGFHFPGHTEYLAEGTCTEDFLMLLISGSLRVGVVTGHIPLKDISKRLTQEAILSKIRVLDQSLRRDFGIANPRIAVFGLNPHAGDGGLLGQEEIEVIHPAIEAAEADGIQAIGPLPADGFFGSGAQKDFDGILGMYHDQGLVPFKALSFGSGVNFTAGLPIIRCSPDHGTAYDIAGKGEADERSMIEAIQMACAIHEHRVKKA
ncbi:MAG: 4-hydroxythreonine-4-phosphate dehydrogenase PdxA [Bacteroidetes bacterium]|nr:4-hydroxythreonine-4-phosphate dehydrogenase PdxA [Bacteroidota bacterium]